MMEDYQTTDIKEEVVDRGFVEVDSQDEHPLCTACLCATRTTRTLDDDALKQYYMHILTEMQSEGGVVLQSPRVCWECVSHLKRAVRFREQVQDSYRLLQPMLSMCDKEHQDEFLQTSVCRPERLKTCVVHSIDISPQDDDMLVMTAVKRDDDDEAASSSLQNNIERLSATYQETVVTIDKETFESFFDKNLVVCVSEDVLPLMSSYQGRDINKDQSEETDTDDVASTVNMENDIERHSSTFRENDATIDEDPPESLCDVKYDNSVSEELVELSLTGNYNHDKTIKQDVMDTLRIAVMNDITSVNTPNSTHESTGDVNTTFVCDYCYKRITSKDALERHIATYNIYPHNNKTFPSPCEDCAVVLCSDDKCSECRKELRLDVPKIKPKRKPFQCKECNEAFPDKGKLIQHKQTNVACSRPYQCEVCAFSFKMLSNLDSHMRTHTGEKPFQCDVCQKAFSQKGTLYKHMTIHTGERPFKCKICHKRFAQGATLKTHMGTHTGEKPFQCSVCPKTFRKKGNLIEHGMTHTGLKPHACTECPRAYIRRCDLESHMNTHTGAKPFQCEMCPYACAAKRSLQAHLREHRRRNTFNTPAQLEGNTE